MGIFSINPLYDSRWPEFVKWHPRASTFHTVGWLRSLEQTYRYQPIALTTSPPGSDLTNGLVFCRVKSWLTGSRLVSLPFSDHCQHLVDDPAELEEIIERLKSDAKTENCRYIELRPLEGDPTLAHHGLVTHEDYRLHRIDLSASKEDIFHRLHDSCVRRKIRKADREQLIYESGRSPRLLRKFRHLMLLTRRRHRLPPQPVAWFENLIEYLGPALTIHIASKDEVPVASIITLRHKASLMYKYGGSDAAFHHLGGIPFLFWKAIQEAKESGANDIDLGRSQLDDPGLSVFKAHLGGVASNLTYYRYLSAPRKRRSVAMPLVRRAVSHMPDPLFSGAGWFFYKHIG
jgi:Acetyltransferase (GNAT) domain